MPVCALVREVSPSIVECELTHLARSPIDLDRARAQHRQYVTALEQCGCLVEWLPPEPELPDAVFVEDTAVVLPGLAVITRPGAPSRRPETASTAAALGRHRPLHHITDPGTLDGGDVLRLGRTLFVGRTPRSNAEGIRQLGALVKSAGYDVRTVPVTGCLHLKSAVTALHDGLVLCNPAWVDPREFGVPHLAVDPGEPFAANALPVGGRVIHAAEFPRTAARIAALGLEVLPVPASELGKAEGGVTCCSVLLL